ncbi:hypothetical protein HETIRDRAFT_121197 [Heterobasidion irregulare TC 32-1]|uniref:MARVEL domain-containing protein n=1 Tax=Heterobasidion irregulare (strain TC 32-1) TaxID=747525 RepID=W4KKQ2_HETIT|nr:uncharacterized protein HETIRDRAFT_121197 [Heterobasidion irregulare TC 32-1]ETW86428.1 hypothetical protein HETIRDRAFT_121197 [Heterobasidion irregulare TC 32-1]
MAIDRHVRRGHTIVFGLLIFFGIIELAIASWITSRFNARHDFPSLTIRDRTRFLVFASAWTIVFSGLFALLFLHSASTGSVLTSVAAHSIVFFFTWVFWTAGAASITAALGGGLNCSNTDIVYCNQLNAVEAFAWVEWVLTTFAIISVLLLGVRALRRGDGYRAQLVSA